MKTRKTKWLSILLAFVMCLSCIQPVHAADESNSDQTGTNATYYYNNDFDTAQDLSSSFTGATYSQEFNASQTAGHIKFQVGEGATEAQFTAALTDAEVKNILVEVELSTTEAGLPNGALKLAGKNTADEAVAVNLIYFGGDGVYTTADRTSGIATVSASGFAKLGLMLNVSGGTLTSADVYQFDAAYETWEFLGTTAIVQSFASFTDIQLYAEEVGKAILFDDLKVYSHEVSATYYSNDFNESADLKASTGWVNASYTNPDGHLVMTRDAEKIASAANGKVGAQLTATLTSPEVKSLVVEFELSTTEAGLPNGFMKILGTQVGVSGNKSSSYLWFKGNELYTSALNSQNGNEILTITPGEFTKLRVVLSVDGTGIVTTWSLYKYDETNASWDCLATVDITDQRQFAAFKSVILYVNSGDSAEETILLDNLTVYSTTSELLVEGDGYPLIKLDPDRYADPEIYPTEDVHPRVLFTSADIDKIKANFEHEENKEAYDQFVVIKEKDCDGVLEPPAAGETINYDAEYLAIIEAKAFDYVINGNTENGEEAVLAMTNYLNSFYCEKVGNNYYSSGHVIFVASEVYDWCHDLMDDTERRIFVSKCEEITAESIEIGFPPVNQGAIVGHGSGKPLLKNLMALAIATYDEYPEIYDFVAGRFYEEYVPAREWWFESETHNQGDSYGPGRFDADLWAEILLSNMDGQDAGRSFIYTNEEGTAAAAKVAEQWIYTMRPDGQLLREGDNWVGQAPGVERWSANTITTNFYSSFLYKNPIYKNLFLDHVKLQYGSNDITPTHMLALNDTRVEDVSFETLPLSKYFGSPSGTMIARTGWNMGVDSQDVIAYMKIGENNVVNHQHSDAGNFQIYYKGILASESGTYVTTNSPNYRNYTQTSIAHNTLSITSAYNTTGKQFRNNTEPKRADDLWVWTETGEVIGQEFGSDIYTPEYSYIAGDIAKAYAQYDTSENLVDDNVTEAVRSMLFMPLEDEEHPAAFVVFDRITTQETGSKKSFLLHMQSEPTVDAENQVTIIQNTAGDYNGMLTNQTLLPVNAEFTKIGGEGHEFQVGGIDYEAELPGNGSLAGFEPGWGRVEISTTTTAENQTDYFLNVMYVNDANQTLELEEAELIETDLVVGAKIFDRVAVFNKEKVRTSSEITFSIPEDADVTSYDVNVAGLQDGTWTITTSAGAQTAVATVDGGMVYFSAPAGICTLARTGDANTKEFTNNQPTSTDAGVDILLNDVYLTTPVEPEISGEEVMVPVIGLFEAMGAVVSEQTDKTTVAYKGIVLEINENGATATASGNVTASTTNVLKREDDYLVPFSFLTSAIPVGFAQMEYNSVAKLLVITAEIPYDWSKTYDNVIPVQAVYQLGDASDAANPIWNAFDGDLNTRWATQGINGTELGIFDFAGTYKLDQLMIAFYKGTTYNWGFDVAVSTDGVNYTKVNDEVLYSSGDSLEFESFDMGDVEARYVKILGYSNGGTAGWNSYNEILFIGEAVSDSEGGEQPTSGYTAGLNTLSEEVTVGASVSVNVAVNHSKETETAFAAGEVVVTYDSTKLSFNQEASDIGAAAIENVIANNIGTLTLEDHGVDKNFDNAVYMLTFDAIADGEAAVTMTSAAFVNKEVSATSNLIPATISPDTVTLMVSKVAHSVTLPEEGFTGAATVNDGENYTFSVSAADGAYYEYGEVTATIGGTSVTVINNGNGTYTIENVTGELVIIGTRTPKSFDVKFDGTATEEITGAANKATYGTDYSFTMPKADGFAYKLESLTIGGVASTDYTVDTETNVVTISGSAIKGEIAINISKTATKAAVTVNGSGASAAEYEASAVIGEDYTLTITPESGWTYTVTATMSGEAAEVIDNTDNTYTVKDVTGPIVFTVERKISGEGVEVTHYLTLNATNVWLVKKTGAVDSGKVPAYDGNNMFWSEEYDAYCYLVIAETIDADSVIANFGIADGTATNVDYGMDVNVSGKVDASDAQLTYNIYNAMYSAFTQDVTMEKFLRADVNADAVVNVEDAAAVITHILGNN